MAIVADADDVELNCILDRHSAVAFSMATEVREESPDVIFDPGLRQQMGHKMANSLTYSVASTKVIDHPPKLRAHVSLHDVNQELQVAKQPRDGRRHGILAKLHLVKNWTPLNYF